MPVHSVGAGQAPLSLSLSLSTLDTRRVTGFAQLDSHVPGDAMFYFHIDSIYIYICVYIYMYIYVCVNIYLIQNTIGSLI